MSEKTDTDMAQALRKLHKRWLDLSTACTTNASPSYVLQECAAEVEAILALHDTARAQPANVPDGQIAERLDILRRICTRGKNYFVETQDSMGVDLFDHMTTEVGYLAGDLGAALQPPVRECERNSAAGCACKNVCVALSGDDPLSGVNQSQLKKLKESTNDL